VPGVLGPGELLDLYAQGLFPMADSRDDTRAAIVDPPMRGILPLQSLHIPRRLRRSVRQDIYEVRVDTAFGDVVTACAAPAPAREDTWISHGIEYLYGALFTQGAAHSVECWQNDELVGGLYGVRLGGAFFGESMFSTARDASKIALIHLVARLLHGGFSLLDTQFMTRHLAQFGAQEITRADYHEHLKFALEQEGDFTSLPVSISGKAALKILDAR
jgi:leucyl/phenylalanyl-tRNA---protein transferase